MDRFDVRGGVVLIAATNRPDVLDPAFVRPRPGSTARFPSRRPT
ncbi:AAA family ATPase [Propioniciclava flava]